MNNVTEVLNNIVEKFQTAVESLGPNVVYAWEQIVGHTVIMATGVIIFDILILSSICFFTFFSYKNLKLEMETTGKKQITDIDSPIFWISFTALMLAIPICGFVILTNLSIVYYPEGYLLKNLLSGYPINQ